MPARRTPGAKLILLWSERLCVCVCVSDCVCEAAAAAAAISGVQTANVNMMGQSHNEWQQHTR